MRYMSFALTTERVRRREKTVTRRTGWRRAKPGLVVQPVVQGQGLKRGEHVEPIGGPIRFVAVTRESLAALVVDPAYGAAECRREGFPELSPAAFVAMFAKVNRCNLRTRVTRIEFEYVEDGNGPTIESPSGGRP